MRDLPEGSQVPWHVSCSILILRSLHLLASLHADYITAFSIFCSVLSLRPASSHLERLLMVYRFFVKSVDWKPKESLLQLSRVEE